MRLNPKHPPGRANRKARAFEAEIHRLRSDGYTCEAIRAALAEADVHVSLSTVQREARRSRHSSSAAPRDPRPASTSRGAPSPTGGARATSLAGDPRSGKEIAADFMSKRITNPLLRDRNPHESRGH